MTCGLEQKTNQTRRYLVLVEIYIGIGSVLLRVGGRALNGLGPLPRYQTQSNSEYRYVYTGTQTAGDNLRGREGNNPDHQLRSLKHAQWLRKSLCSDSQDVGLEAATI